MAIYTRFGSEVKLITARLIPVWIEKLPSEIKWHYAAKKPSKRTERIDEVPLWHIQAEHVDGDKCCDGKWVSNHVYVADGGWAEIQTECERLNPGDAWKYTQWNANKKAKAGDIFDPEPEKNIA
jgi:hypothetical protein